MLAMCAETAEGESGASKHERREAVRKVSSLRNRHDCPRPLRLAVNPSKGVGDIGGSGKG